MTWLSLHQRHLKAIGVIILLLVGLLSFGLFGRRALDRPVAFVIPDNFSGPILLVSDPGEKNRPLKTKTEYLIEIPETGILYIDVKAILTKWHTVLARYRNGQSIHIHSFVESAPSKVGFSSGPTSVRGNSKRIIWWHYIGPATEADAFFHGSASYDLQEKEEKRLRKPRNEE